MTVVLWQFKNTLFYSVEPSGHQISLLKCESIEIINLCYVLKNHHFMMQFHAVFCPHDQHNTTQRNDAFFGPGCGGGDRPEVEH